MPKKILVIDDDALNVKLVTGRLQKEGYEVIAAFDGDVGLEKVKEENPDFIILDVEMPRMSGYSFMLELKKMESCNSIPVVALTAHEDMQPIFELKGVKGYLIKPVDFEKLFELIEGK